MELTREELLVGAVVLGGLAGVLLSRRSANGTTPAPPPGPLTCPPGTCLDSFGTTCLSRLGRAPFGTVEIGTLDQQSPAYGWTFNDGAWFPVDLGDNLVRAVWCPTATTIAAINADAPTIGYCYSTAGQYAPCPQGLRLVQPPPGACPEYCG